MTVIYIYKRSTSLWILLHYLILHYGFIRPKMILVHCQKLGLHSLQLIESIDLKPFL